MSYSIYSSLSVAELKAKRDMYLAAFEKVTVGRSSVRLRDQTGEMIEFKPADGARIEKIIRDIGYEIARKEGRAGGSGPAYLVL